MASDSRPHIANVCFSSSAGDLEGKVVQFSEMIERLGFQSSLFVRKSSWIFGRTQSAKMGKTKIIESQRGYDILNLFHQHMINPVDIYIVHRSRGLMRIALLKVFFPRIKIIVISHTFLKFSKKDIYHNWIYQKVDQLVCLTELHRENLAENIKIDMKKIQVIPHGIDQSLFHPAKDGKNRNDWRTLHGFTPSNFVIGIVGRLDQQKGQKEAIEAFAQITDNYPTARLAIVGQETIGEFGVREALVAQVARRGLQGRVVFVDHTHSPEIVFQSIDMLLVPSYFETFGLVIIEAMASGCFVAATNAGGPQEILGTSCGLLFEPRSVKAIAEAIEKSIQQPEYRKICVNNALAKTSKCYSAEHQDFGFAKVLAKWNSNDGVTFPYLPIGD